MRAYVIGLALGASAFGNLVHAQTISEINHGGSGCPQGSVQAVLSPDATALSVLYDQFTLATNAAQRVDQKNCELMVRIQKPKHISLSIESADFRGAVHLETGAEVRQRVKVEAGVGGISQLSASFAEQTWRGPVSDNYNMTTNRPLEGTQVLSCFPMRKDIKIKIKAVAKATSQTGAQGLFTLDSADSKIEQKYHLKWINCVTSSIDLIRGLGRGDPGISIDIRDFLGGLGR